MKIRKIIFYLLLAVFPFGQLFRFQLPFFPASVRFQPIDILSFIFVLVSLKKIFPLSSFFKKMAVFGIVASLSLTVNLFRLSFSDFLPALFYLLRLWNYFLFFSAMEKFLKTEKVFIFKFLLCEGIIISIFALAQYVFLPDMRFLYKFGWDDHYFRALGTFLDPGFLGILISLSLIVFLINFPNNIFVLGFFLLTIALTFSRMAYLSLSLGLFIYFLLKKKFAFLGILMSVFIIFILLSPKPGGEGVDLLRKNSLFSRFDNYSQALSIAKDNLLIGVGFNAYRFTQRKYGYIGEENWLTTNSGGGADNSFLFVLATTGIIGLVSFLYWWGGIFKQSYSLFFKSKSAQTVFISISLISFASFFSNVIFYPWIFVWLMIILAQFTADNSKSS